MKKLEVDRIVLSDKVTITAGDQHIELTQVGLDVHIEDHGDMQAVTLTIFTENTDIERQKLPDRVKLSIERVDSYWPCENTCDDHKPVQHRDGKEPWCKTCGLTADGQNPTVKLMKTKLQEGTL